MNPTHKTLSKHRIRRTTLNFIALCYEGDLHVVKYITNTINTNVVKLVVNHISYFCLKILLLQTHKTKIKSQETLYLFLCQVTKQTHITTFK